jgi:hypothetical protein
MSLITLSGNNTIDSLLVGTRWGASTSNTSATLTYSYPNGSDTVWKSNYQLNEPSVWSPLSAQQYEYFKQALNLWTDVANITLTEIDDNQSSHGDIRIAYSNIVTNEPNTAAWAYVPTDFGVLEEAGDIWLSTVLSDLEPATFGFSTLLHELGHALGLKHPFDLQSNNRNTLSDSENTSQYTLMSYINYEGAGNIYTSTGRGNFSVTSVEPTTPMLYDIQALQYIYGANTTTRIGNDTYTFSNIQGEIKTIWDAGGIDTFDLSNQSLAMNINLNAGKFSSLGVKKTSLNGPLQTADNNIAIAFNTIIENAIGGSGNDTIIGNTANNTFTGGAGNDVIDGSLGQDTAIYAGNLANYRITALDSNRLQISSRSSNEGIDTLSAIEILQFSDQSISTSHFLSSEARPSKMSEVTTNTPEGDSNHFNYFLLELSAPLESNASVSYQTQNGSAIAGQDYIKTSGIATISAGKTSVAIAVEIIADNIAENNETFSLLISNPQGGIFPVGMESITATHTILDDDNVPTARFIGVNNQFEDFNISN